MPFKLIFSFDANSQIKEITKDNSKKGLQKQLDKILDFLEANPRHPGLNTHLYKKHPKGKIWVSYVQNNTPQAYRILWKYGKKIKTTEILQIVPHYLLWYRKAVTHSAPLGLLLL